MLGLVLGTALQLQQSQLFAWHAYMGFMLLAPVVYSLLTIKNIAIGWQRGIAVLALGLLGFSATGLRATVYLHSALPAALEGRDVRVTGVVARLPHRNETGLRFRLNVESALLDGQPVPVPARIDVGWFADAAKVKVFSNKMTVMIHPSDADRFQVNLFEIKDYLSQSLHI